ncbi:ribonuclease H [Trifolium pratense]|uniref:Ribonuclease H n=1 Tax=Trifolium pratense TaxID=57577 RepID=A0A2K3NVQ0_TRIPR|nr:ribonuclease H [Trifolium pratense]
MTNNDLCPRCQSQPETIMHMLRDCEDVQQYWNQFITEDYWAKFFSLGLHAWLKWNITTKNIGAKTELGNHLTSKVVNMAYQIEKEIKCLLASQDENISKRNIHWKRPPAGNALLAKLCGILFGCQMARDMHLTHIILEIDSTNVINMINNRFTSIFYLQPLLHEVISLIHLPGWTIHVNHIHRETNSCVDALAFKGHDVGFTLVMLDSIPAYISTLLDKDLRGACSSIVVP